MVEDELSFDRDDDRSKAEQDFLAFIRGELGDSFTLTIKCDGETWSVMKRDGKGAAPELSTGDTFAAAWHGAAAS